MATSTLPASGAPHADAAFFGHPRGLSTLFFTELWERFSYYGMRALLILFMTAEVASGGLGFETSKAGVIYGLYTSTAYLMCLPGGWLADRFLGQRKAVLYGGIIIAAGHFCLAVPSLSMFYLGLGLIIIGTGLLKPNVSAQVGMLYAQDDARRDAGFSIYYMGINIGAFLAPLICGYLGEQIAWHYGFAAAGVGMVLGVVQYALGGKHLGEAGLHPAPPVDAADAARQRRLLRVGSLSLVTLLLLVGGLSASGAVTLTADTVSTAFSVLLFTVVFSVFAWLLRSAEWSPVERRRFVVVIVLFFAAALFWSAFEQAGSSLNLFADRNTELSVPGWMQTLVGGPEMPASWFQSLNSLFLMGLAPVFAALWIYLGRRNPNSTAKFAWGLVLVGLGFVVMVGGAAIAATGVKVSPLWLTVVYLLHTMGELCLSPVGLSAMTKLAPVRVTGLIMGVWFLATSVGNFIGGQVASFYEALPLTTLFGLVAAFSIAAGLGLWLLVKPMDWMSGGVK